MQQEQYIKVWEGVKKEEIPYLIWEAMEMNENERVFLGTTDIYVRGWQVDRILLTRVLSQCGGVAGNQHQCR